MKPGRLRFHRRSMRLKGYDYSSPGLYFITICTKRRQKIFGEIKDEKMILNEAGNFTSECWKCIPNHYPTIKLHSYQIMPNHLHGILEIIEITNQDDVSENANKSDRDSPIHQVGVQNFEPLPDESENEPLPDESENKTDFELYTLAYRQNQFQHIIPGSIGSIIRGFKIGVTKWFRINTDIHDAWQRNFYDKIIRTEKSYRTISRYIADNPKNWKNDEFYNDK